MYGHLLRLPIGPLHLEVHKWEIKLAIYQKIINFLFAKLKNCYFVLLPQDLPCVEKWFWPEEKTELDDKEEKEDDKQEDKDEADEEEEEEELQVC